MKTLLLIPVLLLMITVLAWGVQDKVSDTVFKDCEDMCQVQFIFANFLWGIDPEWDKYQECLQTCTFYKWKEYSNE